MNKAELISNLKRHTIKSMEHLQILCEDYLLNDHEPCIVNNGIWIFCNKKVVFKVSLDEATWKSRRPKDFKSISNSYIKRMYAGGVYNRISGVNYVTMHIDRNFVCDPQDESHRPNMTIGTDK
jgi:hypothetical protein